MTNQENQTYFRQLMAEVVAHAGAVGRFHEDAFFELITDELVELGEIDTADRSHHAARGLRVDGYAGDPAEDGSLKIILCDFATDDPPLTLTKTDLDTVLKRGRSFVSHALQAEWRSLIAPSSPGAQLACLIADSWRSVNSVHIILITNRPLSDRVKVIDSDAIDNRPVTHVVWDLTRLRELHESGSEREPITIDLATEHGGAIPALRVETQSQLYEGYLATINGRVLAEIFQQHGARLLEQNVRVFLQAKGGVNRGIRDTIKDSPDRFFAYNNGITATAAAVRTFNDGASCEIRVIENLQIVNGGQTTSSLHAAIRSLGDNDNLDRITVQMKITVLKEEDIDVMVPLISRYANSQNKVSSADFHANHQYHLEVERRSRQTLAPRSRGSVQNTRWYYERARGQYADQKNKLTPAKWKGFQTEHPKAQMFTKTDAAKFDMVWRLEPHIVSSGAQKNFDAFMKYVVAEWDRDQSQFHEQYFKNLVAKAIIFRHVEQLVSKAAWYEGGYRANIVAYSISRVAKAIRDAGRVPDFANVWASQSVGAVLDGVFKLVAEDVGSALLSPPSNMKNVSEWAKKADCWNAIAMLPLNDPPSLSLISIDKSDHQEAEKDAKQDGKILNGAEATLEVHRRGETAWQTLESWCIGRHVLTPMELKIVSHAGCGMSLNAKQAMIALASWDKARMAGWDRIE